MRDGRPNPDIWGNIITCGEIAVGIYEIVGTKKRGLEVPKALAEEILPESVMEQAAQDGENLCFTDPVSNAIVADALLEQELVTDPQAAARLDTIRQLDDVAYDTAFEPPVSDYELDGLDLERQEFTMKILDFDLEGSHFIIEADISPRQEADDDMECQWLRYDFDNTQVYKETDGAVSPFQITAVAWAGYQLTADHALKDVIGRISRNETGKLTVHYVCPELQEFFDELKKYPAISGERTIPYFIFHSGDIAKLAYATNEFLYYEDSNYMPLMFRTVDGTLVSDNEFADMGLYESEENVENGTEHILPFTDYGSDVESACDLEDEEDLEI